MAFRSPSRVGPCPFPAVFTATLWGYTRVRERRERSPFSETQFLVSATCFTVFPPYLRSPAPAPPRQERAAKGTSLSDPPEPNASRFPRDRRALSLCR